MTDKELKPNKEQMLAHVHHLFGDCTKDGLIELAWTGPRSEDRDVRHCEMFDITDLDELAERAFPSGLSPSAMNGSCQPIKNRKNADCDMHDQERP